MYISELFDEITEKILLSPSAQYELKIILKSYDGEELIDDMDDMDDDDDEI